MARGERAVPATGIYFNLFLECTQKEVEADDGEIHGLPNSRGESLAPDIAITSDVMSPPRLVVDGE